ncbi:AMP-binding protein [Caenispirillum salinarum]|uniref:AMP-binding protein n=1 Tax=Caenispirillum salinarum TaxID=859058 RepID=UPI00384DF1B8
MSHASNGIASPSTAGASPAAPPPEHLAPALLDLLTAELAEQRGGDGPDHAADRATTDLMALPLGEGGLSADSIERTWLALAAHRFLTLDGTAWDDKVLPARTLGTVAGIAAARLTEGPDPAVAFATSGTTGASKVCRHTLASLHREAAFLAELFAGRRRVVRLVPAHHIYGFLFGVLMPHAAGLPVVDARAAGVAGLPARLEPGDLVLGFPLVWSQAARFWTAPLPADVWCATSTGPCPPEAWGALTDLGAARMVEVYGSSETAGLGWRDHHAAPYRPFPWLTRDAAGDGLAEAKTAEVLPVQDRLDWTPDGAGFHVAGRRDGGVKVAGRLVHARAVARRLETLPGVARAEVAPIKTPGGQRLAATVTLTADAAPDAESRLHAAIARWPAAERPVDVVVRAGR